MALLWMSEAFIILHFKIIFPKNKIYSVADMSFLLQCQETLTKGSDLLHVHFSICTIQNFISYRNVCPRFREHRGQLLADVSLWRILLRNGGFPALVPTGFHKLILVQMQRWCQPFYGFVRKKKYCYHYSGYDTMSFEFPKFFFFE